MSKTHQDVVTWIYEVLREAGFARPTGIKKPTDMKPGMCAIFPRTLEGAGIWVYTADAAGSRIRCPLTDAQLERLSERGYDDAMEFIRQQVVAGRRFALAQLN
jgi:hypothetical protein